MKPIKKNLVYYYFSKSVQFHTADTFSFYLSPKRPVAKPAAVSLIMVF